MANLIRDAFARMTRRALASGAVKIDNGRIALLLWQNQEHFNEWDRSAKSSKEVRVFSLKSELLPIPLPDGIARDKIAFVGIAFGTKPNYSDWFLKYYVAVEKVPKT
jgi:hypothetical protein